MRSALTSDEAKNNGLHASMMLVAEALTYADEWWQTFSNMKREAFLTEAYNLRRGICPLKDVIRQKEQSLQ